MVDKFGWIRKNFDTTWHIRTFDKNDQFQETVDKQRIFPEDFQKCRRIFKRVENFIESTLLFRIHPLTFLGKKWSTRLQIRKILVKTRIKWPLKYQQNFDSRSDKSVRVLKLTSTFCDNFQILCRNHRYLIETYRSNTNYVIL